MSWRGMWRDLSGPGPDIRQEILSLPFPFLYPFLSFPRLVKRNDILAISIASILFTFRYGRVAVASFRNSFMPLSRNLSSTLLPNPFPDQTAMHFVLTLNKDRRHRPFWWQHLPHSNRMSPGRPACLQAAGYTVGEESQCGCTIINVQLPPPSLSPSLLSLSCVQAAD